MKTDNPGNVRWDKTLFRVVADRPRRVFAFGDIHGCFREVDLLVAHLRRNRGLGAEDLCVFIGDYIDRGRDSKRVLDLMIALKDEWARTIFLKGNHEDMLLGFLGLGGVGAEVYLANGGAAFFESYGIEPEGPLSEIRAALPPRHIDFLRNLELGIVLAEFLFVHAGLDPRKSLEAQQPQDVMWIREPFVGSEHSFGKTVVFGHTAFNQVLLNLPYKIGIDTGAIYGNRLSVVELVEGSLFQVEVGDSAVKESSLRDLLGSGSR